jgi:ATP-dependent helicase/nuclease subunit B
MPDSEVDKKFAEDKRRSGLVLNDPSVLEAMESGAVKRYLPVKTNKDGEFYGDSLVNATQVLAISKYVQRLLAVAKTEILDGSIDCCPYYKNDSDNACLYCEYHTVCGFDEDLGDRRHYLKKLKPEEIWERFDS